MGLVSDETNERDCKKEKLIKEEIARLESINIGANEKVQKFLEEHDSTLLKTGTTLAELIKRPELNYEMLEQFDSERQELSYDVIEQVNINIKYDGYIKRQLKQVGQYKKLENKKISEDIDYGDVKSLRNEARQKLKLCKPISIGQASRISGVTPADISVLLVYIEQFNYLKNKQIVQSNEDETVFYENNGN